MADFMRAGLRLTLRLSLKPCFSPSTPVSVQRRILGWTQRLTRPAAGVGVTATRWEAVSGEILELAGASRQAVVLYLHGGGFCVGSPASHRAITSALAAATGLAVHVPDYRLAPEHPYPAALNDVMEVYRSLLNGRSGNRRVILAGDSAGGGLVLSHALAIRDAGLPQPAALVLFSPWVDLVCKGGSMTERAGSDPLLTRPALQRWASAYVGRMPVEHPLCSPLYANLKQLPPMLIQVGSDEVLYDDATGLSERVAAVGGDATLQVFAGLWHDFQLHAGLLPDADRAIDQVRDFIGQVLGPRA